MKLKELNKLLTQYIKAYPSRGDCEVFLSRDEEGNGFNWLPQGFLAHVYAELKDYPATNPDYKGMKILEDYVTAKDIQDMEDEGSDTSEYEPVVIFFP